MLQILLKFILCYILFYALSVYIPFCPCDNALNTWVLEKKAQVYAKFEPANKKNAKAKKQQNIFEKGYIYVHDKFSQIKKSSSSDK